MTPTDAARLIVEAKTYQKFLGFYSEYGEDIARALLAAEERNAALEAENAALRQLAEAVTSNRLDGIWCADIHVNNRFVNWFDRRKQLLTSEGGGK